MANYYWRGGTSKITISNISKNGSGVTSVGITAGTYTSATVLTNVSSTAASSQFNGSYTGEFTIKAATTSSPASDTVTPQITMNWVNGGSCSHNLAAYTHTIITPATGITGLVSEASGWGTVFVALKGTGTGTLYNAAPTLSAVTKSLHTYDSTNNNYSTCSLFTCSWTPGTGTTPLTAAPTSSTYASSKNGAKLVISTSSSTSVVNGSKELYIGFKTQACNNGVTSVPTGAVAHDSLTSYVKYTLKNAVSSILLSNSGDAMTSASCVDTGKYSTEPLTLYAQVNNAVNVAYLVTSTFPGTAYSYVIVEEKPTAVTIATTQATTTGQQGKITLKSSTAGEYSIYLKSSSSAAPSQVSSPLIKLIVTAASQTYYLNPGDWCDITLSYDFDLSKASSSNTAAATISKPAAKTLRVTVPTSAANSASSTIKVNDIEVATIAVQHITVTIVQS